MFSGNRTLSGWFVSTHPCGTVRRVMAGARARQLEIHMKRLFVSCCAFLCPTFSLLLPLNSVHFLDRHGKRFRFLGAVPLSRDLAALEYSYEERRRSQLPSGLPRQ